MRTLTLTLTILLSSVDPAAFGDTLGLYTANGLGAVGDTGTLYLIPQGVYVELMHNDFIGDTDKLLTGSTLLGGLYFDKNSLTSVQVSTAWRLLTPSFKTHFGEPDLENRVGRFADWLDLQTTAARSMILINGFGWKNQATVGYGHMGDHGGKAVHVAVHKFIDVTTEQLTYEDHPQGIVWSGGYESSLVSQPMAIATGEWRGLVGLGLSANPMMNEVYLRTNTIADLASWAQAGCEFRVIGQLGTRILTTPESGRYEAAAGLELWQFYSPSIKYVSSYLDGDPVGQWYLDLVNLNVPL